MERIHTLDVLKLIIAVGVVWAHATLLSLQGGPVAYVLGQGLVRTVVPTFAVISGFLFHSTFHHGRARAWLMRLGALYILWCLIYLPIWWPAEPTAGAVVVALVFGPIHLWYMAALMVALMLIRTVVWLAGDGRRGRRWLIGLAVVCLLCGSLIQAVGFFGGVALSLHFWRNGLFLEFPYAVIGYLVADRIRRKGMDSLPAARSIWLVLLGIVLLRLAEAGLSLHRYGLSISAPPEFPVLAAAFSLTILLAALRTIIPKVPLETAFLAMMIYFLHFGVLLVALHFGVRDMAMLLLLGTGLPIVAGLALLLLARRAAGLLPWVWYLRLFGSAAVRREAATRDSVGDGAVRLP